MRWLYPVIAVVLLAACTKDIELRPVVDANLSIDGATATCHCRQDCRADGDCVAVGLSQCSLATGQCVDTMPAPCSTANPCAGAASCVQIADELSACLQ